jgi:hypothetical protein
VIYRWRRRGGTTSLSVPVGAIAALDAASILSLRDQLSILDLELEEGEEVSFPNRSRLLAEIIPEKGDSLVFASRDTAAFQVGPEWGNPRKLAEATRTIRISDRILLMMNTTHQRSNIRPTRQTEKRIPTERADNAHSEKGYWAFGSAPSLCLPIQTSCSFAGFASFFAAKFASGIN